MRRPSQTLASRPARSMLRGSRRPSRSSMSASPACRWRWRFGCPYIPVTRVENYCASGSEAFRGASYAVASGACRHRARARRREAQGYRLWRPAATGSRHAQFDMMGQCLGARQFRPARRRLPRQARRLARRSQEGDGAYLGQEPRQRRPQSQGASPEQDHRGSGAEGADGGGAARPLRLLRRQRRLGLRHRHDAGDRAEPRQEGPNLGEGAAARRLQRPGGAA